MPEALRFIKFTGDETLIVKIQPDHQVSKMLRTIGEEKTRMTWFLGVMDFLAMGTYLYYFLKIITN